MATEVKMPRLSLTMESGVVLQWLKAAGDAVVKGEDLAEVETDKVNVVMESPATGYLRKLLVETGISVPCDTVIAIMTAGADEDLDGVGTAPAPSATATGSTPVAASSAPMLPAGRAHLNASPAAKNLAKQLGVDLATVTGTGPGGRIGLEDVQRAADAARQAPAEEAAAVPTGGRRLPLSRMRAAIAQRMVAATTTVPQFTVRRRVDMSRALALRDAGAPASEQVGGARAPSVIDVLYLAVARALRAHPEVNASFEAGTSPESSAIVQHEAVNLGIAVALPEGLLVPVLHNAQAMTLEELAAARARLQEEARTGRLSARALTGATFTVSNLGTMNVDEFTAIVNPPEAAILAVGRMQQELVVRDGAIHTLPMISLTVTADHRVLDGAQVAQFLETLANYLEHPEALYDRG